MSGSIRFEDLPLASTVARPAPARAAPAVDNRTQMERALDDRSAFVAAQIQNQLAEAESRRQEAAVRQQAAFNANEMNWLQGQVLPPAVRAQMMAARGLAFGPGADAQTTQGMPPARTETATETRTAPTAAATPAETAASVDPLDRPLRGPLGMFGDLYAEAAQRGEARRAVAGPPEPTAITPAVPGGLVQQIEGIRERRAQLRRGATAPEVATPNIDAARRGAPSPSAITNEAPGSALTRWMRGF